MQMTLVPFPFPVATPPPPGIPEWSKILITALSSFAVGMLLEPFRASIQNWLAKRRSLRILADEVNSLALTMSLFLALRAKNYHPSNPLTAKPCFNTERFDYVYDKERGILYQIAGWDSLKRFYSEAKKATQAGSLTDDQVHRLLMEFALLADRVKDGILGTYMKRLLIDNKFSHLPKLAAEHRPPSSTPQAN